MAVPKGLTHVSLRHCPIEGEVHGLQGKFDQIKTIL